MDKLTRKPLVLPHYPGQVSFRKPFRHYPFLSSNLGLQHTSNCFGTNIYIRYEMGKKAITQLIDSLTKRKHGPFHVPYILQRYTGLCMRLAGLDSTSDQDQTQVRPCVIHRSVQTMELAKKSRKIKPTKGSLVFVKPIIPVLLFMYAKKKKP